MAGAALAALQLRDLSHLQKRSGAASSVGNRGMSHESVWRCRGCRAPLGVVRGDGSLEIAGQRVTIEAVGLARVACGACGAVREWRPMRGAPSCEG